MFNNVHRPDSHFELISESLTDDVIRGNGITSSRECESERCATSVIEQPLPPRSLAALAGVGDARVYGAI
jgi:hypothetical protein